MKQKRTLVEELRSCARGIGLSLIDEAADRIEELETLRGEPVAHVIDFDNEQGESIINCALPAGTPLFRA